MKPFMEWMCHHQHGWICEGSYQTILASHDVFKSVVMPVMSNNLMIKKDFTTKLCPSSPWFKAWLLKVFEACFKKKLDIIWTCLCTVNVWIKPVIQWISVPWRLIITFILFWMDDSYHCNLVWFINWCNSSLIKA